MNLLPDPIRMTHISLHYRNAVVGCSCHVPAFACIEQTYHDAQNHNSADRHVDRLSHVRCPETRIPWSWALAAFAVGAILFAYPLIRTSKLERAGETIVLKRSKLFILILLVLLLVRLLLHDVVEQKITIPQTGGLFFILAFGMIAVWRVAMMRAYRILEREGE